MTSVNNAVSETERPYWNMEIEPLLNTPEMRAIQLDKLKNMLTRLQNNAPFYARMIESSGLVPDRLRNFDEFKEKIPLFNKESLKELLIQCGGDVLALALAGLGAEAHDAGREAQDGDHPGGRRDIQIRHSDAGKAYRECNHRGEVQEQRGGGDCLGGRVGGG